MTDTIPCPGCNATLRLRPELAGKTVKCPRCSHLIEIPAPQNVGTQTAPDEEITEVEPLMEEGENVPVRKHPCPECGRKIAVTATRCPFCQSKVEPGEVLEEVEGRRSRYVPCPNCDAPNPKKIKMTWWGSFYGAALFHVVRCRECGYSYNGRSGGSLVIPMVFFTVIPAIGIAAVLGLIVYLLKIKNYL
jgi:phage FluMu protein Com